MTVARILRQKGSADVATITAAETVADAAAALSSKRIGALVVSNDGKVNIYAVSS